ncbi:MAG: DUF5615 family PIN-like protein [Isosphaeraceae bacterium]
MARLYADENFPAPTFIALRRLGHDVLTANDVGQAGLGISDKSVLDFTRSQSRALLPHNRKDFRNLHNSGRKHSGIVLCTESPDFEDLPQRIHEALPVDADLSGRLFRVVRRPN